MVTTGNVSTLGYLAAVEFGFYQDECLEVAVFAGGPGVNAAEWVLTFFLIMPRVIGHKIYNRFYF